MGGMAKTIGIFYVTLTALGLGAVLAVAGSTLARRRRATDPACLARRERLWMGVVLAALAALLFSTIFFTPYGETAGTSKQVVRAEAFQFGWRITPSVVRAGRPVEFQLRSRDVNHGFGLYDAREVLLKQAQVMPGREQRLVYTFRRPGTYRILCLEYCGFAHHLMQASIEVRK